MNPSTNSAAPDQNSDLRAGSAEKMTSILVLIEKYLAAYEAIYIHCWGGLGHTGMVVGCYVVQQGMDPGQALNRLAQLHQEMSDGWIPSPQSEEQRQMALYWKCP